MTSTRKDTHRLRNLIAITAILAGFVSASSWLINRPMVLRHALTLVNMRSAWRVDIEKFKIKLLTGDIGVEGLSIENIEKKRSFSARKIHISFDPFGFIRGKLVIDDLSLNGLQIKLPPASATERKKIPGRLNIAKLILLKNIELENGDLNQFSLSFGRDLAFSTDEVRLSMKSSILGNTALEIVANGFILTKADMTALSAGLLHLKTSTALSEWHSDFPYFNALSGNINARDIDAEGLPIDDLAAKLSYKDSVLDMSDLNININDRRLTGNMTANTSDEAFDISIDISKPISLPYIGRPSVTIDTAGELSGNIHLNGNGFVPSRTTGSGQVKIEHRFKASALDSIAVTSNLTWKNGLIDVRNAQVSAGDDRVFIDGTIDIHGKKIRLAAKAQQFPLERVFDKFNNPHLKKIFGRTDAEGSFEGWGRDFLIKASGTTYDGGWEPIVANRIKTDLTVTYDKLDLTGTIISGLMKTGGADLSIKFGPKIKGQFRKKDILLDAELTDHPLDVTLAAYGVTGKANGRIHLAGPNTSFTGNANAEITGGSLHDIAFEKASADMDISRKRLVFSNIMLSVLKTPTETPGEITADIGEGQTRFHGAPAPGLDLDVTYLHKSGTWKIKNISWNDPNLDNRHIEGSGSVSSAGPIDLTISGKTDIEMFRPFITMIRGGSGPIDIDLKIRGSGKDPRVFGLIRFNKDNFTIRGAQLVFENLEGALKFDGSRITFDDITSKSDDGSLNLKGWIDHRFLRPSSADVTLTGNAMRYRSANRDFNVEFEGALHLKGDFPNPLLSGDITILDGKYTRDFSIIDVVSTGKKQPRPSAKDTEEFFNPNLDLHVKNTGDLEIRNNVGEIWLTANVDVRGTRGKPVVAGTITTSEGKIHYLGLSFDLTKGFIEFREKYEEPYLEFYAQKEVGVYSINLVLYGTMDNLALDLSATSPTGPLEKRDVVSLILFGVTEQERDDISRGRDSQYASSLAAKSLSGVMEGPVRKFTHLDVFRLEAADPESHSISRLYVGKQISDRLSINFSTDINTNEAEQSIIAEYILTDHLILKGSRSTDFRSEISGLLRFKMR